MLQSFCPTVEVAWLYEAYGHEGVKNVVQVDSIVLAFVLALLGATLFARKNNHVQLAFIPILYGLPEVKTYNWGGIDLAFLYHQMDDVCRTNTKCFGGLWKTWEVNFNSI